MLSFKPDFSLSSFIFLKIKAKNHNKLINAQSIAESKEVKSLLRKVKEVSEKVGLKFIKLRSWHLVSSLHNKQMGKQWKQWQTFFFGAPKSLQMVTAAMKLKDAYSLEGKL